MKKAALMALFLLVQLLASAAIAEQTATNSASAFKIRLPDGLYLYQIKTNMEDLFSPLVIVEDNKLIDPYLLLKKQGKEPFEKKYFQDRQFNVFIGKEPVGKLSNLKLFAQDCDTDEFLLFYFSKGEYEGGRLPVTYERPLSVNFDKYNVFKAVAAPKDIGLPAQKDEFIVTEEDRALAAAAIWKELAPAAIIRIEKSVEELHNIRGHIIHNEGKINSVIAVDLDNNGKKDLVGIYILAGGGIPNPDSEHNLGGFSEMLFVLWDTGKVEEVMSSEEGWPIFNFVGPIDIDKDGVQELIVQKSVSPVRESSFEGVEINILRHGPLGWENIYKSGNLCTDVH
ncbi:MAG: hypothetical protein HZB82_06535 [Deltaproteobacteria bacterium]|nr:hypothetical protein [Deltaproteobacteria bacterium]